MKRITSKTSNLKLFVESIADGMRTASNDEREYIANKRNEQTKKYEDKLGKEFVDDYDSAMAGASAWLDVTDELDQELFPVEEVDRDEMINHVIGIYLQRVDSSLRHTLNNRHDDGLKRLDDDAISSLERFLKKYGAMTEDGRPAPGYKY